MAIIFFRSAIIFIILLIIMRFMGKRQIGEMQPFELVVTLLISELACIPMSDVSIPLLYGIVAIISIFVFHQIFALLEQWGRFLKFVVSGKPSLLINKRGIDFKELKNNNLDVSDLMESLRGLGYYSLDNVKYAIYESNGTLTAIANEDDSKLEMAILIVKDAKPIINNLKILNCEFDEIKAFLRKQGFKPEKVGILTVDGSGNYYAQEYDKPFKTGVMPLKEGVKW
jgi:uncharacterized membrane protein YcaP (DUF421 family)